MERQNEDRFSFTAVAVVVATAVMIVFNWLAATGRLGEVTGAISAKYPTKITPASYAFSIWTLIYAGLVAFSLYQLLPKTNAKLLRIRWAYLATCFLNAAWLYLWGIERIVLSVLIIAALLAFLALINIELKKTETKLDYWLVKFPFGLYFGWVTVATILNVSVAIVSLGYQLPHSSIIGAALVLIASILGILICWQLKNYFYPLPIAWALTAIAIRQSGDEAFLVFSCAIGVTLCLLASASFILEMPTMKDRI